MSKDETAVEAEIQRKGLNAPRLNPAHIDGQISAEQFHVFDGTVTTVCCLTLRNGYTVIGKSAPASPDNFDAELGRKIARDDARNQIWALEGYLLRSRLAAAAQYGCGAPESGLSTNPHQLRRLKMPVDDLAQYKSKKIVRAGEITEVVPAGCYVKSANGDSVLRLFETNMTARYEPQVGDFWVVYEDGYQSISPRQAFVEGYDPEAQHA